MVRIRLRRTGAKKQPSYRIVVADSRSPRDGKFIETIGFYNPRTEPPTVEIKVDRALYWLSQGAQPSEAVERMLRKKGILDKFARLKAGESLEALLAEPAPAEEPKADAELEAMADQETAEETEEPSAETEEETPDQEENASPEDSSAEDSEEAEAEQTEE